MPDIIPNDEEIESALDTHIKLFHSKGVKPMGIANEIEKYAQNDSNRENFKQLFTSTKNEDFHVKDNRVLVTPQNAIKGEIQPDIDMGVASSLLGYLDRAKQNLLGKGPSEDGATSMLPPHQQSAVGAMTGMQDRQALVDLGFNKKMIDGLQLNTPASGKGMSIEKLSSRVKGNTWKYATFSE